MDFYSDLAPWYHHIFQDWRSSIGRQGGQLAAIIQEEWGDRVRRILDAAAGIGTQSLALAERGFAVTASDLSAVAVARLRQEAAFRDLEIATALADLRRLSAVHGPHDLVVVADNSLPHLLDDAEISAALAECHACTEPGGGCLITIRDYPEEPGEGVEMRPHGSRVIDGVRHHVFQIWEWDGPCYDLSLVFLTDTGRTVEQARVHRTRYYAVAAARVMAMMEAAGYRSVKRLDGVFYQPVLVGTRPEE